MQTITFRHHVAARPSNDEVDELMVEVSKQLGKKWLAAYGDGGWYFKPAGEAGVHSRRRNFIKALADSTGCAVVSDAL